VRHIHRLLATALLALAGLVIAASPAWAHTGFESSDPANGVAVEEPVDTITLIFTGQAEPTGTGFQVLDAAGELREPTEATTTDGTTWVLQFDPALSGGAIGVRWMVKAPDAHPIDGSFSFTVTAALPAPVSQQDPAGDAVAVPDPAAAQDTADLVGSEAADLEAFLDTGGDTTATPRRVGAVARLVTLVGTLIGVGALIFAVAVLRGDHRDIRHVLHWVRRAGILVVIGAGLELVAQIAVEGGGEWSAVWSPSTVGSVVASSFGAAIALRVVGGAALASGARLDITHSSGVPDPVVAIKELVGVGAGPRTSAAGIDGDSARHGRPPAGNEPYLHHGDHAWLPTVDSSGAVLGAIAVIAAHLFDGHTVTKGDRIWTAVADVAHVTGGAVWAGGVLMLASILWRRHRHGRELRALQLAIRFSVVATIALVAVGVAGLALTVIVLDSPSELWATEWGRTLIAKTLFVGVAAAAGGYNHKVLIPQLQHTPDDPILAHRFRTIVTGEAAALMAALAATALLMGAAS
jgi:copper transport protein